MVTIDAAKALGMEKEIGSLEPGKKADIILLDWFKPHLVPMNMPVYRVVYYANGEDVSTVLVDGRILVRDRRVLTMDEEKILVAAQRESNLAIQRAGLPSNWTQLPDGFWGTTRLRRRGAAVIGAQRLNAISGRRDYGSKLGQFLFIVSPPRN